MDNLDAKYIKFINAYLKCTDAKSVCKECNITINTYYKYLNDKAVKKEINKKQNYFCAPRGGRSSFVLPRENKTKNYSKTQGWSGVFVLFFCAPR